MADLTLPVNAGSLPSGFCPSTFQEIANAFAAIYSVTLAQGTGVTWVFSATKPTDTSVGWFQLDSFGRPVRPYLFAQGAWLSMHPLVPGHTMIWTTTLPTFTTFDGGDANALSAISGPMWEEVTALRAKFPIGAGTLPSGTVLAVGDTGGEEEHAITVAEMPTHSHFSFNSDSVGDSASNVNATNYPCRTFDDSDDNVERYRIKGNAVEATMGLTSDAGTGDATSLMPPYVTVYFLRRTSRLFYSIP